MEPGLVPQNPVVVGLYGITNELLRELLEMPGDNPRDYKLIPNVGINDQLELSVVDTVGYPVQVPHMLSYAVNENMEVSLYLLQNAVFVNPGYPVNRLRILRMYEQNGKVYTECLEKDLHYLPSVIQPDREQWEPWSQTTSVEEPWKTILQGIKETCCAQWAKFRAGMVQRGVGLFFHPPNAGDTRLNVLSPEGVRTRISLPRLFDHHCDHAITAPESLWSMPPDERGVIKLPNNLTILPNSVAVQVIGRHLNWDVLRISRDCPLEPWNATRLVMIPRTTEESGMWMTERCLLPHNVLFGVEGCPPPPATPRLVSIQGTTFSNDF